MIRRSFDEGWTAGPAVTAFAAIGGGPDHPPVTLPHDAVRDLPRSADAAGGSHSAYFPGGYFQYEKTFDVPAEHRDKTVVVEFEGVYRDAVVYLNGDFVAQRPNGYSGFSFTADPYLRYGEPNTIRVECRAHQDSRWYTGAGIHRPTHVVVTDLVHVPLDGVRVTTPDVDAERAVVAVATTVANADRHTRTVRVSTRVTDPTGAVVARGTAPVTLAPGAREVTRARLVVESPALWSVDAPHLHTVETTVTDGERVLDEDRTVVGIRTLQLDARRGLRINGEPVDLRGACIHSDAGLLGSAAVPRADERRVEILKAAGFNAIRSAHNPVSRATLDACDRLGVLVMDELSDIWTKPKTGFDYSLAFPEWWERDVEAMVVKDVNHPSVVLYSIGNEIFDLGTPLGSAWGRRIAEKIRSLDGTRFVTNGINPVTAVADRIGSLVDADRPVDVNTAMTDMGEVMNRLAASEAVTAAIEESASVLDVVGLNYADSRIELDRDLSAGRVLVGSETFPGQIAGLWRLVQENPHVLGDFTWTGWDYLGEVGIGRVEHPPEGSPPPPLAAGYPWLTAWCADVDITGHRRPQSYYRETVFGLRHVPYIAVHRPADPARPAWSTPWSWPDAVAGWSWDVPPGTPLTVDVYSDAEEVQLLLDGRPVGHAAVGGTLPFLARFEVAYQPGELVAVACAGGTEQARTAVRTATGPLRLVVTADREVVRADATDLVHVEILLADEHGTVTGDRQVSVEVTGPSTLAGLGSGRPRTEEPFGAARCTTFDGRALAVVRPSGAGEIEIRISAENCAPVTVTVRATEEVVP